VTCWDVVTNVAVGWDVATGVAVVPGVVTCGGVATCGDCLPCCGGGREAPLRVWDDAARAAPASCEERERLCGACVVTEGRRGGEMRRIFVNFVVVEMWEVDVEIVELNWRSSHLPLYYQVHPLTHLVLPWVRWALP